jgi:hypothetical protein
MGKQRMWMSLIICMTGVTAAAQPGQTGGADLSKINVLRDLEYVPGGPERRSWTCIYRKQRTRTAGARYWSGSMGEHGWAAIRTLVRRCAS